MLARLRPALVFLIVSAALLGGLFFRAATGSHLLAPLDLAPALFKHYAWMDPAHDGVPDNHYIIDQLTYDLPLQREIHAAVRSGQLPWWGSLDLAGRPLLADAHINGTDPVRLLLYHLLPFEAAYNWNLLLHSLLAGLGAFCLLRSLGTKPWLAGLLGLTWQFSGPMTLYFGHPWIQATFVWYPFLWLAWNRLAKGFSTAALGGAALSVALILFGGNLQSHAYLPLFTGAWLVGTCWLERRQWFRLLPLIALSGIVGALIASPVLAPELDLYRQSQRLPPMSFQALHVGAGPASLTFLFPWALGTFKTVDLSKLFGQTTLGFQLFVGLPVGLAAVAAAMQRRQAAPEVSSPASRRVATLLLLGYLLMVATPAVLFLYTRLAPLATLALVVLAAEWIQRLETESFPRLGRWLVRGGVVLLIGSTLAGVLVLPRLQPRLEAALLKRGSAGTFMDEAPQLRRAQAQRLARELSPANPELLFGVLGLIAFGWYCRLAPAARTPLLRTAVWGFSLLPLLAFQARFAPSHPRKLWDQLLAGGPLQNQVRSWSERGAVRFQDTVVGLHQQVFPNCFSHLYGVQTIHGYAALRPPHLQLSSNVPPLLGDRPLADTLLVGTTNAHVQRLGTDYSSRWIFRTNGTAMSNVVRAVRETVNALEIDFDAGAGIPLELIWTDTYAPGWRAEVAGTPVRLEQFERIFSRIELPTAKGTLRLTYHPPGEGGLRWLAAGAALACLGLVLVGGFRRGSSA